MANPEHVEMLLQSAKEWNEWREAHSDVEPDLSEAKLGKEKLNEADLSYANLGMAYLSGAVVDERTNCWRAIGCIRGVIRAT